jgi:hypothetical protein
MTKIPNKTNDSEITIYSADGETVRAAVSGNLPPPDAPDWEFQNKLMTFLGVVQRATLSAYQESFGPFPQAGDKNTQIVLSVQFRSVASPQILS